PRDRGLGRGRRCTAPGASGHRPVRDRAHDDAPGPALTPRPRLLDAAEVRARAGPQGDRRPDRAALPPLRAVCRTGVLALRHARLGTGAALGGCCRGAIGLSTIETWRRDAE